MARKVNNASGDSSAARWLWLVGLVVLPLAVFLVVLLWEGSPASRPAAEVGASAVQARDTERAQFARCGAASRYNCVVDGDTIWYQGTKIRVADINTPELSQPECAREAELAEAATRRLTDLLNQGAFSLEDIARSHDKYGCRLQVITRGGESLGDQLVAEGLAETWQGSRSSWC
ncbi:MAG: Endonuclease YncB precursor [Pseudomonadota bacterium]|jgi:endonuclease YncB( thermonuclease family)